MFRPGRLRYAMKASRPGFRDLRRAIERAVGPRPGGVGGGIRRRRDAPDALVTEVAGIGEAMDMNGVPGFNQRMREILAAGILNSAN